MADLERTVFWPYHEQHAGLTRGFGGFEMPVYFDRNKVRGIDEELTRDEKLQSIANEHRGTRHGAGLFDVSHMVIFDLIGKDAAPLLQKVGVNNTNKLSQPGTAIYTMIPDRDGMIIDDGYIYRLGDKKFRLVVNAGNAEKVGGWIGQYLDAFPNLTIENVSQRVAMMALQGPNSEDILQAMVKEGHLPYQGRGRGSQVTINGTLVDVYRTGYAGEKMGLEFFAPADDALPIWEEMLSYRDTYGVIPAGLGARNWLREEKGLPLGGNEFGGHGKKLAYNGKPTPVHALSLGRMISDPLDPDKIAVDMVGREALTKQYLEVVAALENHGSTVPIDERLVPYLQWQLAFLNQTRDGMESNARVSSGAGLYINGKRIGWVSSSETVPTAVFEDKLGEPTGETFDRSLGIAFVDASYVPDEFGTEVEVARTRQAKVFYNGLIVRSNLREGNKHAVPVDHPESPEVPQNISISPERDRRLEQLKSDFVDMYKRALDNTRDRQFRGINLVPSENIPTIETRLGSILDPSGRYGEYAPELLAIGKGTGPHAYYPGTEFVVQEVTPVVESFLRRRFNAQNVEVRPISGQMSDMIAFRGIQSFLNRHRKGEPQRIRPVFAYVLGDGGHLTTLPGGGLKDFIGYAGGAPDLIPIPMEQDMPHRPNVELAQDIISDRKPQLIVMGRSLGIEREPWGAFAEAAAANGPYKTITLADLAHHAGLVGADFQSPLDEGFMLMNISTHKSQRGTQRGGLLGNLSDDTTGYKLWQHIQKAGFPSNLSNHHLGTLLGLALHLYEDAAFGDEYRAGQLSMAKSFAQSLKYVGFHVEGDPDRSYTETNHVAINVGKGRAFEVQRLLQANGIYANRNALPGTDLDFKDASGIRMGTAEMVGYGFGEQEFAQTAEFMADIVLRGQDRREAVADLRAKHTIHGYRFKGPEILDLMGEVKEVLFHEFPGL